MTIVAKPHKQGTVQELDGSSKSLEVQRLYELDGAQNLNMQDYGQWGNPDGAAGKVAVHPDFRGGAPNGGPQAGRNASGKGAIHPTGQTTAPMSNPFPAPSSSVRTSPSSIKV